MCQEYFPPGTAGETALATIPPLSEKDLSSNGINTLKVMPKYQDDRIDAPVFVIEPAV